MGWYLRTRKPRSHQIGVHHANNPSESAAEPGKEANPSAQFANCLRCTRHAARTATGAGPATPPLRPYQRHRHCHCNAVAPAAQLHQYYSACPPAGSRSAAPARHPRRRQGKSSDYSISRRRSSSHNTAHPVGAVAPASTPPATSTAPAVAASPATPPRRRRSNTGPATTAVPDVPPKDKRKVERYWSHRCSCSLL